MANLKEQVSSIKTSDSQTSSTNCSASQNSLDPLAGKQPQFSSTSHFLQSSGKHLQGHPYNSHSKKFNLVFFGIAESPSGTKYHSRLRNDHAAITSVLDSLDESLSSVSVRDCVRLGKFSKNHVRPRPLLVKFNSAKDVNTILSKKFKLFSSESHSKSVSIKCDLSKEERHVEKVLLTERRRLIDQGTDRKHIKIHGNRIFVKAKPIGLATPTGFSAYPTLGDVAPSLLDLAESVHHPTLHDQSMNLSSSTTSNVASTTSIDQPLISVPNQTTDSSQISTSTSSSNSQPENAADTPTTSLIQPVTLTSDQPFTQLSLSSSGHPAPSHLRPSIISDSTQPQ